MNAVEISNLNKTYASGVVALQDASLTVKQGDFFALLGPNGAGKTTMIGILTSLVNKTSGKVSIFGNDLDQDLYQAKLNTGLVPQEFNISVFEKTKDVIATCGGYYGVPRNIAKQRTQTLLKQLELWDKRNTQVKMLSGGMKRRLMIARALVHQPKLLILDEPTAGVDIEIRRSMWAFLKEINEQGVTIILTTHYLEEAENLCNNIAIINHGKIIEDTSMNTLLATLHTETMIAYLDKPIEKSQHLSHPELTIRPLDIQTIEIDITPTQTLSDVIFKLTEIGVKVNRIRNKTNRLESQFLNLVHGKEKHTSQADIAGNS